MGIPNPSAPLPTSVGDLRTLMLEMVDDPDFSRAIHLRSDVDFGVKSQHHTLGNRKNQAFGNGGNWHYVGNTDEIAFQNGWTNTGSGTTAARYRKDTNNRVWVEGVISGGANGNTAFTLPIGCRLTTLLYLPVVAYGAAMPSFLQFGGGGFVVPNVAGSPLLASFSFSFIADG